MKNIILLLTTILLISFVAKAQDYQYSVKIYNNKGRAYPNVKVWFENKVTGEQIVKYTNSSGSVNFKITTVGIWSLNLIGMHDKKIIKIKEGQSGSGSQTITYDLKAILKEQEFVRRRALTKFTTEDQSNIKKFKKTQAGKTNITIYLNNEDGKKHENIPVSLVSVKDKKVYTNTTGKDSKARFVVPNGQMYAIDVENAVNYSFTMDLGRFTESSNELGYIPTNIVEHTKNDTITQEITSEITATSTRAFITLRIAGGDNGFYTNEPVYLKQVNSNKIYKGVTDENGEVSFLVPNGTKLMINFKFQFDVDVIDLSNTHGQRQIRKQIYYSPIPELEHPEEFIPKPEELFLVDINALYLNDDTLMPQKTDILLSWGNEKVNSKSMEAVLQLNLMVSNQKTENTKPTNIAFVIDKSGSMCGENRIEALKVSMIKYVNQLNPDDNATLVTFNSDAYMETSMQKVSSNSLLVPLISDISPGGGTNIYKGMCLGYSELEKNYSSEKNNMLILLTDGYGSVPIDSVVNKSKEYNEKGIILTAVGVGECYNTALLTLLTQESGTLLQHAGKSEDIYKIFSGQLANSIYPIGTDGKLEITYNDKITLDKIFGLQISKKQKNIASIDIGNVFAGKKQIALIKFNLQNIDKNIKDAPVKVVFSYKDINDKTVKITKEARLVWQPESGRFELIVDNYQKKLYAIATMNRAIKVMADNFCVGNPIEARKVLEQCKKDVKNISPNFNDQQIKELFAKVDLYLKAINNFIKNQK